MIGTNTLKGVRVTRERKVRIIANPNDTYEYIEGSTSNQRYLLYFLPFFLWLLVATSLYSYLSFGFAIIPTFLSLVDRSTFDRCIRTYHLYLLLFLPFFLWLLVVPSMYSYEVGIIANTNDTYECIEGATSNQRKKGRNYNKYKWYLRIHWRDYE
jgi:hypothetical protein